MALDALSISSDASFWNENKEVMQQLEAAAWRNRKPTQLKKWPLPSSRTIAAAIQWDGHDDYKNPRIVTSDDYAKQALLPQPVWAKPIYMHVKRDDHAER